MGAKDLGTKYICFKCTTKFYDMKKPDPVCPKCGSDQRESPANKPVEPIVPAAAEGEESEEEELDGIEEEEPVVEEEEV